MEAQKAQNQEITKEERVQLALKEYQRQKEPFEKGEKSKRPIIRKIALDHDVTPDIIERRLKGSLSHSLAHISQQRLTVEEEEELVRSIDILESWGFPPRIKQLTYLANVLLAGKGDLKPVGIN